MYLWRRLASKTWLHENETALRNVAGERLAIIERPDRKQLQLEVAGKSRASLQQLAKQFGGKTEKLSRDWLRHSLRQKTKPVTVANRKLIIPAGAAFGTGEHATTAMCLRLLEKLARTGLSRFSMIDLGTGTGILAIAAKVLGAKSVIAIDNDPVAISTAKENARSNRIRGIEFRVSDVRNWTMTRRTDVLTANLFSELLVEILPKLRGARSLILSGLLREQEGDVRRALTQNRIRLVEVRRRGKWVAMLAASR